MNNRLKAVLGLASAATIAISLTGCSSDSTAASSASMCTYTVGNGTNKSDRNIHEVLLPGQDTVKYDDDKISVKYFPCGSRNYRVGATSADAEGKTLLSARTSTNTPVNVSLTVYWMVNQDKDVIRQFIAFCEKYQCASGEAGGGSDNFSTAGWNGMLGENFHSTLQSLAERAFIGVDDTVWQNQNLELRENTAKSMSSTFAEEMRKRTGFTSDLFCGSSTPAGNDGKFDCTSVRITVDKVEASNPAQQNAAANAAAQEQSADARVKATEKLYGPELARQFRFCEDLGEKCKVVITPQGAQVVVQ